ncbi:MAG: NUDIX domain-containing protein [Gammaproteobacteria bacterium]
MDEPRIEIVSEDLAYEGFFRLYRYRLRHRLFGGGWSPVISRELFERGHAAAILPYDPRLDAVVLIEQFRIGALQEPGGPWLMEIVAGIIEPAEHGEAVVRREAEEEAGCVIGEVERICRYLVSPGGTSETMDLFCGRVDAAGVGGIYGLDAEDEDIRAVVVPFQEAWAMLERGRLNSAAPIIALQWLQLNRVRLRAAWGAAGT